MEQERATAPIDDSDFQTCHGFLPEHCMEQAAGDAEQAIGELDRGAGCPDLEVGQSGEELDPECDGVSTNEANFHDDVRTSEPQQLVQVAADYSGESGLDKCANEPILGGGGEGDRSPDTRFESSSPAGNEQAAEPGGAAGTKAENGIENPKLNGAAPPPAAAAVKQRPRRKTTAELRRERKELRRREAERRRMLEAQIDELTPDVRSAVKLLDHVMAEGPDRAEARLLEELSRAP